MKATEYAEKYSQLSDEGISNPDFVSLTKNLFKEMKDEMLDIADKRCIKTFKSLILLEKEFNTKGNKVSELLGYPLKKDWYKMLFDELKNKAWRETKE